jgi:hypothetical protein
MPNTILTPDIIAKDIMFHLENEMTLAKTINADFSSEFNGTVGDTINVRRPVKMTSQKDNLDVTNFNVDLEDATVPVVMNKTLSTKFTLLPLERTLDIRDERVQVYTKAAALELKDKIEQAIAEEYYNIYFFGGTAGTRVADFLSLALQEAAMSDVAVPREPRYAAHSNTTMAYLADSLKQLQVSRSKVNTALEAAMIGNYAGFDNFRSVHIPRHVSGVATGTPLVNGANQNVTYAVSKATWSQSLVTDGWTNSTTNILRRGDVFTIGGVFEVNPVSRLSTGRLQTFTVLAAADSGASTGPATLTISPPIITTGPYQTVTAAPADDAPITVVSKKAADPAGTIYEQSLLYHRDFMTMVTRPLAVESGQGVETATTSGNRTSIRVTKWTDGNTLKSYWRADTLFGLKVTAPYLARRQTN